MCPPLSLQMAFMSGHVGADFALERLLAGVCHQMIVKVPVTNEHFVAGLDGALEGCLPPRLLILMNLKIQLKIKYKYQNVDYPHKFMRLHVLRQIACTVARVRTEFTLERLLAGVEYRCLSRSLGDWNTLAQVPSALPSKSNKFENTMKNKK